ncbi:diacylglycerol/lipid kinase family protein [Acetobacter conturbans]|uniref:Diacylglycerol kinase n=1 Tax=Acetobacter conturbans TaxID=1737472 RepID=A0ABX0JZX1_9PROT|nr:diacylglycerol kinase family protein [Acetobacter conturbans]NHN89026.1 diacylglycerol kinase [Acetobacter conturbans]
MPARVALIHNPRSRRNVRDDGRFVAEARKALGSLFVCPASHDALRPAVAELARQDVRVIAVNGGDGTVSDVISAVLEFYPADHLPALSVFPSGNTNLIANDVGCTLRGMPALSALSHRARTGTLLDDVSWRQPVVASWPDPDRLPVAGMFCGLAAFTRAIELAHNPAILERYSHDAAIFATLLWGLRLFLRKETRHSWMGGSRMTVTVDNDPPDSHARFLFLCTGLHQLSRGVWPFWLDDAPRGGLIYLDITGNPPGLARGLLSVLRGRISGRLRVSKAYRSGMAASIRIETQDQLVMDGEELDPGPEGVLYLKEGPRMAFIRC